MVADLLVVVTASYLLFALHLRQVLLPWDIVLGLVVPAPLFVLPALHLAGVYDVMMRFWNSNQLFRLALGSVAGTAILGTAHALVATAGHWNIVILQGLIVFLSLGWLRFVTSALLRPVIHGVKAEKVLIYGAGRSGTQLCTALMASGQYWPVAFVDDRGDLHGRLASGLRVHAPDKLPELRERLGFTRVLLAMPSATVHRRAQIVRGLEPLSLKVMVMPSMDELACGNKQVGELRDLQVEDLLGREPVCPDSELMDAFIKEKSVLITGAGGSIGSELARQVLLRGARRLVLYEMSEIALYLIERELQETAAAKGLGTEIIAILGTVLDRSGVERAMLRYTVQTAYHAAAYKHVPLVEQNVLSAIRNNVLGTQIVVESAVLCRLDNFVLVSSDKAVRPTSVMGATKRLQELIVQAAASANPDMKMSMVRFGNVLASSGSVVPLFREQIKRGGPVTVTHAEVTRYFMTIPEAAQLVIQAGAMGSRGDIFVLDMGEPVLISDLARKMIHLSGFRPKESGGEEGDIEIVYTGLRPGEKLYEELLIDADAQPTRHPRIQRAQEPFFFAQELAPKLLQICAATDEERLPAVIGLLRELVSGYTPAIGTVPGPVSADSDAPVPARRSVSTPALAAKAVNAGPIMSVAPEGELLGAPSPG